MVLGKRGHAIGKCCLCSSHGIAFVRLTSDVVEHVGVGRPFSMPMPKPMSPKIRVACSKRRSFGKHGGARKRKRPVEYIIGLESREIYFREKYVVGPFKVAPVRLEFEAYVGLGPPWRECLSADGVKKRILRN